MTHRPMHRAILPLWAYVMKMYLATVRQCLFNFNIIDFIKNCNLQYRNIVAKLQ